MNTIKIITLTIALVMAGSQAIAQRQMQEPRGDNRQREDGNFAPDDNRGGPPSGEQRENIRKKIEAIRIWRLTEELNLDEKTAAKFLPAISSISTKRQELMRDTMETHRELRSSLNSAKADENKIKAALNKLEKNQRDMQKLLERELEVTKENLSVEQQARYLLFQQDFQREMREMISGARGGSGQQGMQGQGGRGQGMQGGRFQDDMGDMGGGNRRPGGPMDQGSGGGMQPRMRR